MILTTIRPLDAYVGMLSIPRDLWVQLPDGQHNRINTAHFFAESLDPGSGQEAAKEVVQLNFGIDVHYYVRFQFEQLISFVNALGGILIDLEEPIAGYPPGEHLLNGEQALAFVRDRMGTDDFFRMSHAQLFIQALVKQIMQPRIWMQAPGAIIELMSSLDTDIPIWLWPRLGISILRVGFDGLDLRVISREMVSGFLTENGAQVLTPDWSRINPVLMEMFGQ
jgi:LCP family protein required for cell wall assembly